MIAVWDGHECRFVHHFRRNVLCMTEGNGNVFLAGVDEGQGWIGKLMPDKLSVEILAGGIDGPVQSLTCAGETLFAGGRFQRIGGRYTGPVVMQDGDRWVPVGVGAQEVFVKLGIWVQGARVKITGSPSEISSVIEQSSCSIPSYDVKTMVMHGDTLYIGGDIINKPHGTEHPHVARCCLKGALAQPAKEEQADEEKSRPNKQRASAKTKRRVPEWGGLGGLQNSVFALAVLPSSPAYIVAGGEFIVPGENPSIKYIARWDGRWREMGNLPTKVTHLVTWNNSLFAACARENSFRAKMVFQYCDGNWNEIATFPNESLLGQRGVPLQITAMTGGPDGVYVAMQMLSRGIPAREETSGSASLKEIVSKNIILRWGGQKWSRVAVADGQVFALLCPSSFGKLYIAGDFNDIQFGSQ